MKHGNHKKQAGSILILEVVLIFIFSLVILGLLSTAVYYFKVVRSTGYREQAFHVAEAGINYYQWHLAHFPTDFQDGTGAAGPYVHNYVDADTQAVLGQYSLVITPPPLGSTIVTIASTGWTVDQPNIKRTITVRYGIPSLAKYGFLTNSDIWVGSSTTFYGDFHSNGGVHYDGTATSPVTSARSTYTCTSSTGCSPTQTKAGIWGSAASSTQAYWNYPVPNVDYSSITSDLATIRTSAQSGGLYLAPSGGQGYSVVFQSAGNFRMYRVNTLRSHSSGTDVSGTNHSEDIDYNGRTELTTACNPYPCNMPTNGLIFLEDRVWVEGTVNGRAMLVAARLPYNPSTAPNILIPNNLLYLDKSGSHVLGLIAQKDILLTYYVPNNLEINAAFIAQNGSFQRYNFSGSSKNTLTVYGSISSFGQAAVYYGSSGYSTRNYTYDSNLLYGPPPSFPLSSSNYQQISWSSN